MTAQIESSTIAFLLVFFIVGVSILSLVGVVWGVRKKKKLLALVAGLVFLGTLYFDVISVELLAWQFDLWRGWELRFPVERGDYVVTLVQRPTSDDFYASFLDIENAAHRTARAWISPDDSKWWNPRVVRQDGKIYVLRGFGIINANTPYLDPEHDLIYTRFEGTRKMSELPFE